MSKMIIRVEKVRENARLPTKYHRKDVGFDCYISEFAWPEHYELRKAPDEIYLYLGTRVACKLGFRMKLPESYYASLVPRSGKALWEGLTITNAPGTIDPGYRGEMIAIVNNTGHNYVKLEVGDKICQLIPQKIIPAVMREGEVSTNTEREEKGFGSSD